MPDVNTYIGCSTLKSETGDWKVSLEEDVQTNLNNICELAQTIFDSHTCFIVAYSLPEPVILSHCGDSNFMDTETLLYYQHTKELVEVALAENNKPSLNNNGNSYRIIFPIVFSSGLHFGAIVLERFSSASLSLKDKAIIQVIGRDVSNHIFQNKHIIESEKLNEMHTLISQYNEDWIFVKDDGFRIVYANEAFMKVYPEDMQDKIIGFTTIEEYNEEEAEIFLEQDKIAFKHGVSKMVEDLHLPDGSHSIIETVKRRFEDEKGKPYILCICRNITEKEDLIRDLQSANEELDDFTSIASHDLKSPLNAIKRLLEWVQEECTPLLPEEHVENIQLVISRANRMQTLLDDLLIYARIGKQDVVIKNVNLTDLYYEIAQLLDIPETFKVKVPDKSIHVSATPFKTVMLNLIGNALKHNDKQNGEIEISLTQSRHYYVIEVSDNGPGIKPQYFEKIFELFQTLKSRDELEGSGIGLCVIKKHMNCVGGKVQVESDGKQGSKFTIYWPVKGRG